MANFASRKEIKGALAYAINKNTKRPWKEDIKVAQEIDT